MSVNNQVLKRGASGDSVKELQNLLNQNGANLEVDGVFGPNTQSAVVNYQQSKGLTVDGMVGNETMGALTGGSTSGSTAPAAQATPAASGGNATAPTNTQAAAPSGGFSYDEYKESDTVSQAYAALQQQMAAKPGEYKSTWEGQMNDLIDRIMNREDFSYDVNNDALYQQLREQYAALGKVASEDVMGQAAAMTGGYGSSYASTAGNQAYQAYLSQLNEMVPELYGMARDQHNQEGQELYSQYGLLADQENQDYGRWVDDYNQWASERDHLEGAYKDERAFDYGKHADEKSYAYNEYRNAIADQQWQTAFDEGVRQYDEGMEYQKERDQVSDVQWSKDYVLNVKANNRAQEAWEMEKQAYEEAKAAGSSSGESGSNQAALQYVKSMSSEEIVAAMKAYQYDEDDDGLDAFLTDCMYSGRLTKQQVLEYYEMYSTGKGYDVTDTTVKPTTSNRVPGGGGGKFGTPMVKE